MKTSKIVTIVLLLVFMSPLLRVHASIPKNISDAFKSKTITTGQIALNAPDMAENGAVVPVSIKDIKMPAGNVTVKEIWFFTDTRKEAIAHFILSEQMFPESLSTRVKLAESGNVYAVAVLSDGSIISGHKVIKVTSGGCGDTGYYTPATAYQAPALSYAHNTEKYEHFSNNGIFQTSIKPVSTFSIDVDTGSYTNIRRFLLKEGHLPVSDAVRIEEMINYFSYQYPVPDHRDVPFSVTTEVGPSPWNQSSQLLHIGLKGYEVSKEAIPPANLVFLLDVSGSMSSSDKLPLLKSSMKLLSRQLRTEDRVSIVVYAGASGVVLEPTSGNDTNRITAALEALNAGGSTNGGQGIQLAYAIAKRAFIKDGVNRVILATDGDFNVGTVNHEALLDLVKQQRESGITLTTLGFGRGNYNEKLMEQLADTGNGNYAYIDSFRESRKVLMQQLSSTLFTIARDVKIQVEFNPAVVAEYRLIGYENRMLNTEDFKNDKVDAGDIGAGHTVTAVYEINLHGSNDLAIDPLRYGKPQSAKVTGNELAYVRLRYKSPEGGDSKEISHAIYHADIHDSLAGMSDDYRFSSAVAAFGQLLRGGQHIKEMKYLDIVTLAKQSLGDDNHGYRREFLEMVNAASAIQ